MLYPCPCCGYLTLTAEPPNTYIICPICAWEDDGENDPFSNGLSLRQAQRNFLAFGASDREWLDYVRPPTADDVRDPNWQAIDEIESSTRLTLIEKITTAFEDVRLEDGISLHQARALDDYDDDKAARKIDSHIRWQDIPNDWIEKFSDVFNFLDAKGFRHYIPAYMIWCLKPDEISNSNSLQSTIWALASRGFARSRFKLLNPIQLQVISEFLEFINTYDP